MNLAASVDLGTNTCLLLIAEMSEEGKEVLHARADFARVIRLGEGVDQSRKLQPKPMDRAVVCLKEYSEIVRSHGLDPAQVCCVATSQARDAQNSAEFFERVQKETGFRFRTLTGEEEAHATFIGALLPGMDPQGSSVIDIGGGSTEIITLSQKKSLDMGSVRFTERYLKSDPVTDDEFWSCQAAIDSMIEASRLSESQGTLVAVAGTATTLAAWYLQLQSFDASKIDGLILTRGDIHRMVEELKWRTLEERKTLPGMEPLRADVLLAGALILWRTMELLGFSQCQVSSRGLRYGVLSVR